MAQHSTAQSTSGNKAVCSLAGSKERIKERKSAGSRKQNRKEVTRTGTTALTLLEALEATIDRSPIEDFSSNTDQSEGKWCV